MGTGLRSWNENFFLAVDSEKLSSGTVIYNKKCIFGFHPHFCTELLKPLDLSHEHPKGVFVMVMKQLLDSLMLGGELVVWGTNHMTKL